MTDPLIGGKYPGRERVISRDKAREILWREQVLEVREDPRTACQAPIQLPAIGLPSMFDDQPGVPLTLTLPARCRKCEGCLTHRRRLWTARARDMIAVARRTWFGTLTVAPAERFKMRIRVERRRLRAGGEAISSLDATEQFRLLADELGTEATRWLKRVRSVAKGPLRYLLVAEEHKTGDPHLHVLLHEFGEPITKRELENQWRYGFSHWRLVGEDQRAASYVCKYLSKDLRTRVRASIGYGQPDMVRLLTERIERMRDTVSAAVTDPVVSYNDDDDGDVASHDVDDDDESFSSNSTRSARDGLCPNDKET